MVRADHFSGASISYQCLGNNNYKVILEIYLDCAGQPMIAQSLNFTSSCGTTFSINNLVPVATATYSPVCPQQANNTTCDGGTLPGFRYHRFEVQTYLSPCNYWNIHWSNCCRNTMVNVQNIPGIYVNATLNNSGGFCDNSPVFTTPGVPFVCVNNPMSYNAGVVDPDGHSLSYSLVSAQYASPTPTAVTYNSGYTGSQPIPGISLNSITGQINFTPTIAGYYTVVLQATSFKPSGEMIGKVMYDMMFIVPTCDGAAPSFAGLSNAQGGYIIGNNQISICDGVPFCVDLTFTDNDPGSVIAVANIAQAQMPGSTIQITGTNPATATLCWSPENVQYPMNIVLQASDQVCPVSNSGNSVITAVQCVPLNIPLENFMGELVDEDVHLRWNAEANATYVLERSDGTPHFELLGQYTTDAPQAIHHRDPTPRPGLNIYRLSRIRSEEIMEVGLVHVDVAASAVTVRTIGDTFIVGPLVEGIGWEVMDIAGRRLSGGNADASGYAVISVLDLKGMAIFCHGGVGARKAIKLPGSIH